MKTSELYIEQVLIGLLIIAIALLPWVHELRPKLDSITAAGAIAEGSVLLGLAFLLGIPFDRFADTLSERLEQRNRLQFALNLQIGKRLPVLKWNENNRLAKDIYPENRLRLDGLGRAEGVVNLLEYHRSRIRLARALAVYGPALTFSFTFGVSPCLKQTTVSLNCLLLSGVPAAYLLWALLASPPRVARSIPHADTPGGSGFEVGNSRALCPLFGRDLPRTDKIEFISYAKEWNRINEGPVAKATYGDLRVWSREWRLLVVPLFLLAVAIWLGFENGTISASIASTGAVLTVISGWSWWRISRTYRGYLHDLDSIPPKRREDRDEHVPHL